MSNQVAPPPAQAAPPQAQPPLHQAAGPQAAKLHDLALGAEKNLEQLATGLAQQHADPAAVKACTQMAAVCRKLVSGMAQLAQQEQPPAPPPQSHTMGSATNAMAQDLAARRAQPQ